MAKLPYIPFFTGDWMKDPALSLCRPSTRGFWIDALCAMHESDRSDSLSGTPDQLARVCRCTPSDVQSAVEDLKATGAATIRVCNGVITIISRRFQRERRERLMTRNRVARFRGNGDVTPVKRESNAGYSSSISSSEEERAPPAGFPPIPPELDSPSFRAAWDDWVKHRREIGKPLKPTSVKRQFAKLLAMGQVRAIAAIESSTANGYQGIYEPGTSNGKHPQPEPPEAVSKRHDF